MGLLRSKTDMTGSTVNGVLLGGPVVPVRADGTPMQPGDKLADLFVAWDDSAFPTGVLAADGSVTPDVTVL